jgi:hypothetical protein
LGFYNNRIILLIKDFEISLLSFVAFIVFITSYRDYKHVTRLQNR